jgi:hypothetical protein
MIEFTLEELEIIQTGMSIYEKRNYNFRGDAPYETPITPILRKLKIMVEDETALRENKNKRLTTQEIENYIFGASRNEI